MPKHVAHYKCLVVSPSDVDDAREAVVTALLDWNAHTGENLDVKIEAVRWESHARPEMGAAPQAIINKQIVDDCDFGIAVFWSRLGSPTEKHPSGSVEEIERLLTKGANVMVYFCDAPIPQGALKDDQYKRLQDLKHSYEKRGLLARYTTVDELRRFVSLHVNGVINGLHLQQKQPPHSPSSPAHTTAMQANGTLSFDVQGAFSIVLLKVRARWSLSLPFPRFGSGDEPLEEAKIGTPVVLSVRAPRALPISIQWRHRNDRTGVPVPLDKARWSGPNLELELNMPGPPGEHLFELVADISGAHRVVATTKCLAK